MAYEKNMDYAGFWKRFAAVFIDGHCCPINIHENTRAA